MKIIAIDSSGLTASVAILSDDSVIAQYTINYKKTHSQTLLPMLDELKRMTELDLGSVDAIAIAKGPGSFTGLRIGSATAKGLGLALDIPIIPVPTVEGIAYNMWGYDGLVCPIMDARRDQVYTGVYYFENGVIKTKLDQCAVSIGEICEKLNEFGQKVVFLGDGVPVFKDKIAELMKVSYEYAPPHLSRQSAAALGVLAFKLYEMGVFEAAGDHKPDYLRLSQAERERLEANKSEQK